MASRSQLERKQQISQESDDEKKEDNDIPLTSQWQSQMFVVERDGDDTVGEIELSEYFDTNISKKTRKLVYPLYILIALAALAMIFMGLFGDDIASLISMLTICTMTWVGAIVGMLGVYIWGTVEDCVDWFRAQNDKFESNIDHLKETRTEVKRIAKDVFDDVKKLQDHSKELSKHLGAFEELRNSLEEICGENQKLEEMLDEINDQYKDLVTVISQNERASLLSIYYEVSILDRDEGLSRREYEKFLGRLNNKTKQLFKQVGDFDELDEDDSGVLELDEFEKILDKVIAKQEELNIQDYMHGGRGNV